MLYLAFRQLLSRPQQTILTLVGITLGSAAYIIFSGIMLGFQAYLIDQLINNDSQIRISPRDEPITPETFQGIFFPDTTVKWIRPPSGHTDNTQLTNVNGWFEKLDRDARVSAYAPQLKRQIMLINGKINLAVSLVGIDPAKQMKVTTIAKSVVVGELADVGRGGSKIILGAGLMERLGVKPGDTVQALTPGGERNPLQIKGVINSGNRMLDESICYASINTVQRITGSSGEISDIVVRLQDVNLASEVASEWAYFSRDKVESWDQTYESILAVFKTQDIVRNTTTFTIILVVAFGIYNILNMVVNQKKKEIAILRSIGFDQKDTIRLFVIQGISLGFIGAIFGLLIGALANSYIDGLPIGTAKPGQFKAAMARMMVSWDYMIFVKGFLIAFLSSLLASFIPARSASKLSPVEIIRGSGQ